ncbi:MAG: hypothetical protein V7739_15465 [Motiliproteus sp.]
MSTLICHTNCPDLNSFADELKRLANSGLVAATHSDIQLLQPGEFMVDTPIQQNAKGSVYIYYREWRTRVGQHS